MQHDQDLDMPPGSQLLHLPWEAKILQHLSAGALGALACTCKQLREAVRRAGPDVWCRVAREVLGPTHPSLQEHAAGMPPTLEALQAALAQYGKACAKKGCGKGRAGACHPATVSCTLQSIHSGTADELSNTYRTRLCMMSWAASL